MTGYTPIYNLPYPQASDLVSAYPGTGQDLAEEVETVLAAKLGTLSVNAQTGTTYTLTTSDPQKVITMTNAAASSVTIPTNATAAIAIGSAVEIVNLSTGVNTTVSAAGGVTFNGGPVVLSPGSSVTLVKIGTDAWMAQGQGSPGLVHIATASFSAVSSVSVNNCFSTTYSQYLITRTLLGSVGDQNIDMRLRASGTDASGANYRYQSMSSSNTTVSAGRVTGATSFVAAVGFTETTAFGYGEVRISNPFEAVPTTGWASSGPSASGSIQTSTRAFAHDLTSSYDGFTIIPASGTITGTLRIYAYRS